jgi:hypothetical protein
LSRLDASLRPRPNASAHIRRSALDDKESEPLEIGLEVVVAEAGCGCVQRGVSYSTRLALRRVAVSMPVTCSASRKYSA